ncbi:MAG: WYL domain-containing protein [Lachnospiraceae bacterium]|jgi:predicted DNA-binding transcriptional regulator YafY|nr:WYL domain-containing protein [Lachnospiraceae bacterium]
MPKGSNQKLKILYLMDLLLSNTDEEKGLTMKEILTYLESNGIKAERKSIYDDMEALRLYGVDILTKRDATTEYYVGERDFELPELKLLVDAVQSSKFITQKKSAELIGKLESLTSKNQAKSLQRAVFVSNRIKTQNESIYYNVDALHVAILGKRKVSFKYFDYDAKKKRVYRKDGKEYITNPLGLSWNDENYYLIAYSNERENFAHYRVDRMLEIKALDEAIDDNEKIRKFDIVSYCKPLFDMFGGEIVRAELIVHNSLINAMIDRFGKDVFMIPKDENTVRVIANVTNSDTFYGWVTGFGDKMLIESPKELREEYLKHIHNIIARKQDT